MPRKKKTLPEEFTDAAKVVEEYTGVNIKKVSAKTTRSTYAAMIAALPLALGPVGSVPTISHAQELVKRPEEHLASQSQFSDITDQASAIFTSANTTGGTVELTGQASRVSGGRLFGVVTLNADAADKPTSTDES
jgi:hypothetical protein